MSVLLKRKALVKWYRLRQCFYQDNGECTKCASLFVCQGEDARQNAAAEMLTLITRITPRKADQ